MKQVLFWNLGKMLYVDMAIFKFRIMYQNSFVDNHRESQEGMAMRNRVNIKCRDGQTNL